MVPINQSIVLIALADISRKIRLNPLDSGNASHLLWMMMGFMVVTAVLAVSFGKLGDMYGRVRMYNLGFAVFTICSILLSVSWTRGAFPATRRGTALGINAIAAIGYNPMKRLLGPSPNHLPAGHASYLTGRSSFPRLITSPLHQGLVIAFLFAIVACLIAAFASLLIKGRRSPEREAVGSEPAAVSGEAGGMSERNTRQTIPNGHGTFPAPSYGRENPGAPAGYQAELVHEGSGAPGAHGVEGFVHDGAGNPVSFAAITIAGPDGYQLGRTNSGPDGHYAFEAPPGDYLVITSAPGWSPQAATVLVGAAGAVRDFALAADESRPSGEIRGVVRSPEGTSLGGITTTVTDEAGEVIATTTTGYDGSYHITGLSDGHYTVVAAGHRPATVAVRIDAGEPATVRVALGE